MDSLSELDWTRLDLPSLPYGSPTLERVPELARERGWQVSVEEEETTPRTLLPGSWDDFLAGLRKKDRHELRRKLRRLDRENVHSQYPADSDALELSMQDFFTLLRASREDKDEFLTPDREKFFLDIARESASRDQFRLYFLEVDGERVAACICFDYGGEFLLYNSGYEPSLLAAQRRADKQGPEHTNRHRGRTRRVQLPQGRRALQVQPGRTGRGGVPPGGDTMSGSGARSETAPSVGDVYV